MSTPAHHDPDGLKAATLTAARLQGCNCRPDLKLNEQFPGMFHVTVEHDSWCLLLQSRTAKWN